MYGGFSQSVTGNSHVAIGLVCQDHSANEVNEHYVIAAIADGHGSKKYFRSHMGSQFAVEAALETVKRFYLDPEKFEKSFPKNHKLILKNIEKQIIVNWNARVQKHLEEHPVRAAEITNFTKEEFQAIPTESYYGTTLVVAVIGRGFCFGVQIGDGSLVALFEDGEPVMPMNYDESAPANMTASMCNNNAAAMFNSFYIEDKRPIAFYASSDGLYTSFGNEDDFLDYHLSLTTMLDQPEVFGAKVTKDLNRRSHFGTEDDISLACAYDTDLLNARIAALKEKAADLKATAAERKKKRLEAMKNIM